LANFLYDSCTNAARRQLRGKLSLIHAPTPPPGAELVRVLDLGQIAASRLIADIMSR
jgi:hypothetical protein